MTPIEAVEYIAETMADHIARTRLSGSLAPDEVEHWTAVKWAELADVFDALDVHRDVATAAIAGHGGPRD